MTSGKPSGTSATRRAWRIGLPLAAIALAVIAALLVFGVVSTPFTDGDRGSDSALAEDDPAGSKVASSTAYTAGDSGDLASTADPNGSSPSGDGKQSTPVGGTDPNPAQGGLPNDVTPPSGAVSYLSGALAVSQTYEVEAAVLGWRSKSDGTLYARVQSAKLLGPINPSTGEPMGSADPSQPDRSGEITGLLILGSTNETARPGFVLSGDYLLRLVLVPSGDGAVFYFDKVLESP